MSVYKSLNNMNCMFILLPINVHFRCLIVLRYYNQLPVTVRQCPVLQCPVCQCPVLHCPVRQCPVLQCPVMQCPPLRSRPSMSSPAMSTPANSSVIVQSCNVQPRFFTRPSMSSPAISVNPVDSVKFIARAKIPWQ